MLATRRTAVPTRSPVGCVGAWLVAVAALIGLLPPSATAADSASPLAVDVTNRSEPVACAEKDNVTLEFGSPTVLGFRIEAAHPSYAGSIARDSFAADWTACDMRHDPAHASGVKVPTRRTIWETPDLWLVAWTFPNYWRPATAMVRVGNRVERGVHLLQLWTIRPMGGEEILVVYPQDGYWRIRPLAPEGRAPTAFGSSFLVGPVEVDGRPLVALDEIVFDPVRRSFGLKFKRGGSASLRLAKFDREQTTLAVSFDRPVTGRPFAAMRSMYVTEFNNDVARVAVSRPGEQGWTQAPVMGFTGGKISRLWAGRHTVSRHNTSSPDMVFDGFTTAPAE